MCDFRQRSISDDTIAPADQVAAMYNSLPDSVDRARIYFLGMDRMTFAESGNATQKARMTKYIAAFMKYLIVMKNPPVKPACWNRA